MKGIVVYGSNYGTTRAYAQELARRTGWPAVDWQQAQKLAEYETVVYLGGLYAGGVVGLKKVLPQLEQAPEQKLVVVTVGVADPAEPENVAHIRASLQKQLPGALYQKAQFAHLRGGIDYSRLNFKHRAMMWAMVQMLKKRPPEQQSAEDREIIRTYNQKVDFTDLASVVESHKREEGQYCCCLIPSGKYCGDCSSRRWYAEQCCNHETYSGQAGIRRLHARKE